MTKRPLRQAVAACVVATLLLASCTVDEPMASSTTPDRPLPSTDPDASTLCPEQGFESTDRADAILDGNVRLPPNDTVQIPEDIDWSVDPLESLNWQFQFHALRYLWILVDATRDTGDERYVTRAREIARDWVDDNPREAPPSDYSWNDHSTAWRAAVLACLHALEPAPWLTEAVEQHRDVLADPEFYVQHGNHALNQNYGLLQVGCELGDDEAMQLAQDRSAILLRDGVDEQGVMDEQAVEYQLYNLSRYRSFANSLEDCGLPPPAIFDRLTLMPEFLAHATLPDGTYAMLGDTDLGSAGEVDDTVATFAATAGARGERPAKRFATYDEGFAFSRSGWGDERPFSQEAHVSVRYGPPRRLHGHFDHSSITFFSHGRRLLVDPGKYAYTKDDFSVYVMAPRGHNVVLAPDCADSDLADHRMTLEATDASDRHTLVRVAGEVPGCDGSQWERTVVFSVDGRHVLVIDEVTNAIGPLETRWHLPPEATATAGTDGVTSTHDDITLHLFDLSGSSSIEIAEGQRDPMNGWFSPAYNEIVPAPVVLMRSPESAVRRVTALVPAPDGATATATLVEDSGGRLVVDVDHGAGGERIELVGDEVSVVTR